MASNLLKGFRYQKRISLGKYLRLNISKTGIGFSVGVPGLRYTRGPSGTHLTVGLPGSGIRYQKKLNDKKVLQFADLWQSKSKEPRKHVQRAAPKAAQAESEALDIEKPGFFAPGWEKDWFKGVTAYRESDEAVAIANLREAAEDEDADLGVLILLASLLADQATSEANMEAIPLLEDVVTSNAEFPSSRLEKYMQGIDLDIDITPQVEVILPVENGLAATLLLVELYQSQGELQAAIDLLEEVNEAIAEGNNQQYNQILTLSLVELYTVMQNHQAIIDTVQVPETIEDDVMLEVLFFYGRALQEQNLHTAAIKVFTKCLRRKKGFTPTLLSGCRLWRAMSYLKVNQKARARKELERVLAETASDELKQAALQALRLFWPQDFSAASKN